MVLAKRPKFTATLDTTIIRQALILSDLSSNALINTMRNAGPLDESLQLAINRFFNSYNKREEGKIGQQKKAQIAKIALEQAAMSIPSGHVPDNQSISAESSTCTRVFDFFFTVLERNDTNKILGGAFTELVSAMKRLEQRKIVEAITNSDEGEV